MVQQVMGLINAQEIESGKYYAEIIWKSGNGPGLIHFVVGGLGPYISSDKLPNLAGLLTVQ